MDYSVKNFLFQLKKGKKKKEKKERSRSNDFGSDEYSYSIYIQIREYPSSRILAAALNYTIFIRI